MPRYLAEPVWARSAGPKGGVSASCMMRESVGSGRQEHTAEARESGPKRPERT